MVDVGGAVARPGVYRLPEGSRVGDAIEAAGGYGATVDAALVDRQLNLAATVRDGEKIRVPVRGEPRRPVGTAVSGGGSGGVAATAPRPMAARRPQPRDPPRRSTRCPASVPRPSRRSWPRVNSSRSPPSTTCWRARSSARPRSRSCGRSSPSGRERGARAGATERLARRRGCHRCRLGLGGTARGRRAGRRAAGARRWTGGAAIGHPGRGPAAGGGHRRDPARAARPRGPRGTAGRSPPRRLGTVDGGRGVGWLPAGWRPGGAAAAAGSAGTGDQPDPDPSGWRRRCPRSRRSVPATPWRSAAACGRHRMTTATASTSGGPGRPGAWTRGPWPSWRHLPASRSSRCATRPVTRSASRCRSRRPGSPPGS